MHCALVLRLRFQFFYNLRCFSNKAKPPSKIQRFGMTLKVAGSVRVASSTFTY